MAPTRSVIARLALVAVAVVAIAAMHGSAAEAHACTGPQEARSHESPIHEASHPDHHDAGGSGESPGPHCGALSCAAIVTSPAVHAPHPLRHVAVLLPGPVEPPAGSPSAPEPPVPRLLLHV